MQYVKLGDKIRITFEGATTNKRNQRVNLYRGDVAERDQPEKEAAESMGIGDDENIEFCGYVSEEGKWRLLAHAKALIMTQKEDFGITAVESMAAGKPVIAYKRGGAKVTVEPGETGEFFKEQTVDSLVKTLKTFDSRKYSSEACQGQSCKFTKGKFQAQLEKAVNKVYLKML
jgi:glycosyltransferase involved in cell wall biosynthesis